MSSEQGIITKITGDKAFVSVQKTASCAGCRSQGSCDLMSGKDMILEVENHINGETGDIVEISVPDSTLLKLSFMVYFFPIIALIAGAFIGKEISPYIGLGVNEAAIAGGIVAIGVSFAVLKLANRLIEKGNKYQPQMTRIIARHSHNNTGL